MRSIKIYLDYPEYQFKDGSLRVVVLVSCTDDKLEVRFPTDLS